MNFASTNRKQQPIKAEDISLRSLTFEFFDIENQTPICFTLPHKTIYNEIGYQIQYKQRIGDMTSINFINNMSILLLVSIKDRKIQGDESLRIEAALENYQPVSHVFWITLELFKSVARLASRTGIDVPDIIKNDQKAWKDYFMREVNSKHSFSSKRQYIKHIRKIAKSIREGRNPFDSESPELKIFVDQALALSDINQNDKNQPNNIRALRKHIRQRLKDFNQALTAYATYLERSPCKIMPEIDGRRWERGIKGHLKLLQ
jgi:hypothetical protein